MALLFVDSFDHYNSSQMGRKWTKAPFANIATPGRTGPQCAVISGIAIPSKTLGTAAGYASMAVGCGYQTQAFANNPIGISNAVASLQIQLQHVGDGRLYVTLSGGFASGYSTFVMGLDAWYYLELQATIGSGSVSYVVRVNGATILSGSLGASITGAWDYVFFVGPGGGNSGSMDDVYITDGELLGDVRIYPLYPRLDGTYVQWVPSSGTTHYNLVNEHTADDMATYVSADSLHLGNVDQYYLDQILGFSGDIKGSQALWCVIKTDAGDASIQGVYYNTATSSYVQTNGMNPLSPMHPSYLSWEYFIDAQRKSVFTGNDWTPAEINQMQLGIQRYS